MFFSYSVQTIILDDSTPQEVIDSYTASDNTIFVGQPIIEGTLRCHVIIIMISQNFIHFQNLLQKLTLNFAQLSIVVDHFSNEVEKKST